MLPVVAQDHKLMKRLSSRKAIMMRMERPTWRDLKLTAFMAPAETPHTLAKSLIPRSRRTSMTPALYMPLKPPPSRMRATP